MNKPTLMLVEDEKIIALDLQRSVEKLGYHVGRIVSSGEAALDALEEYRPNLILMDIMLGSGMNGIECALTIRSRWQLPVVFLTAYADEKILDDAKRAEPYGYIIKPFRTKDLQTTLEIALYKHSTQLAEQEKHVIIQAILDNAQEGLCTFSDSLQLKFMNKTAQSMFDLPFKSVDNSLVPAKNLLKVLDAQTLEPIAIEDMFPTLDITVPVIYDDVLIETTKGDLMNASLRIGPFVSPVHGNLEFIVSILDISTQKNMARSIDYQTKHDALTDLPNRAHFLSFLIRLWNSKVYEEKPYSLLLINLDKFKVINELAGHTEGDMVLRNIARDLESTFKYDTLSRLSADEFALIIQASHEQIATIAEHLREAIERKIPWNKEFFLLTASIGVVQIDNRFSDSQAIMAAADDSVFIVKSRGGNGIEFFSPEHKGVKKHRGEMVWINRIVSALEDDRFILFSQTLEPLRPGLPKKKEILIRLRDEKNQLVSPGVFIGAAERYKLMSKIDLLVVEKTFSYMKSSKDHSTIICINLSGTTLQDDEILSKILVILKDNPTLTTRVVFEITETAAIQSFERAIRFISSAKASGSEFALDDFGNGFSSFAYLKKLPITILKIDGSYVRDMMQDHTSRAMVAAINTMSHELGIKTVAEFVSSVEVLDELIRLGVDYAQGYVISEPKPLI